MDTVQTWTLVGSIATATGVFSAVMFAALGMFRASIQSTLDGFAAGIDARFVESEARLEGRFAALDTRFAAIDARFDAVDARIDNLARATEVRLVALGSDMHLIKAHLLGQRSV